MGIVSRYGAGFDTVDTAACARHGVWVANSPDYGVGEVATHALAMALALLRHLAIYDRDVKAGRWSYLSPGSIRRASDLTVGILGLGRIGKRFAHLARNCFGRVIACDPYIIDGDFPAYVQRVDLDALFEQADIVSLHVPLNDETRGMVKGALLGRMRRGSMLVNTARGAVVDIGAVLARLDDGTLDGAALDVLPVEPLAADHPLARHPRALLTPARRVLLDRGGDRAAPQGGHEHRAVGCDGTPDVSCDSRAHGPSWADTGLIRSGGTAARGDNVRWHRVAIRGVAKRFGATTVIHGVDIDIADGEFAVLVGPSGCGKTTLLRMIAGLEEITDGEILIGDRVVNRMLPKERDIAMVFQNYALYPHMTVRDNMSFSLRLANADKATIDKQVARAADILGLGKLLDRYPRQLSGGQRQRVAMGRAIVRDPQVFLFDEPLSNLDAKLRVQMRTEIKELHQRLKTTSVYVTHDQIEAMTMADKIVVMKDGIVEQTGGPLDLYDNPANTFVAGFIGSPAMNLLPGKAEAQRQRDRTWCSPTESALAARGGAAPAGRTAGPVRHSSRASRRSAPAGCRWKSSWSSPPAPIRSSTAGSSSRK